MDLQFLTLEDVNLNGKRVLMREDFNVPIKDGKIQSDLRIRAALPGIKYALDQKAKVMLMSHLGRPEEGAWQAEYSLEPIAACLQDLLGKPVKFVKDMFGTAIATEEQVVLFENVRFLQGETENAADLAQKMAKLCDVFVLDAFGSAHRAHASTVGVAEFAPTAVAGPLIVQEVLALNRVLNNPKSPVLGIIGGAKVSSKLNLLEVLLSKLDVMIIGGGMANTILAAQGLEVGASLYEKELIPMAANFLQKAKQQQCEVLLPIDVIIQDGQNKDVKALTASDKIFDIGIKTQQLFQQAISKAATILWNGPMGVFEDARFAQGTLEIATAVANSNAFTVAGGGDTLAAIDKMQLANKFSYISTGGGAFLEYLENGTLPAIQALIQKRKTS
jgi:phosphoglycerate kinase